MNTDREEAIGVRYQALSPHLDERARRRLAGAEAHTHGYGGVSAVSRATGLSRNTVKRGLEEVLGARPEAPPDRVRQRGGGRTREVVKDPHLLKSLEELVEPVVRGDPEAPLRWVSLSQRRLVLALLAKGHQTSTTMVASMLYDLGYSLQANNKTLEGSQHPDRDAQFLHINALTPAFQSAGNPVISVDTKKKELVGPFKNAGRELRPVGEPEEVKVHDFVLREGRANPYGVYDVARNEGWVNVGRDHDTAQFAVESIRRWWNLMGSKAYPNAKHLLICADGGGSNGSRLRLWKTELQKLATEIGIPIHVSHLPRGTSKWNKIEHKMFSFISMNWRGKPLTNHETIVGLISSTTTQKGLRIQAGHDTGTYPKGIRVDDATLAAVNLTRSETHPQWNYTIGPAT
ncbi:MAG: hypothetical protein ACI9K2_005805 [Myxococcota bacterium]|jgi:hypothetical protein